MFKTSHVCENEKVCKGNCQERNSDGTVKQKCAMCGFHKEKFLRKTSNLH